MGDPTPEHLDDAMNAVNARMGDAASTVGRLEAELATVPRLRLLRQWKLTRQYREALIAYLDTAEEQSRLWLTLTGEQLSPHRA